MWPPCCGSRVSAVLPAGSNFYPPPSPCAFLTPSLQEQALSRFLLVEGQSVLLLLSEGVGNNQCGSEEGPSSLLNRWLQPWGMHAHHDAVLRRRRHPRFPHPKEVFLSLSSLPETEDDQAGKDERQEEEKDPGFSFVYPYGCSLSVAPPAKVGSGRREGSKREAFRWRPVLDIALARA